MFGCTTSAWASTNISLAPPPCTRDHFDTALKENNVYENPKTTDQDLKLQMLDVNIALWKFTWNDELWLKSHVKIVKYIVL